MPQIQRKWSDKERVLLIKGIEKYGIGHYKEISDEFLPDWVCYFLFYFAAYDLINIYN
jgi:hypothetical protein